MPNNNNVVGFKINGSTYKYDHNELENLPDIDATPTTGSNNAVKSGGVKAALEALQAQFADVFKTVDGLIETPDITNGTWANGGAAAGGNRGRTTSLIRCKGKISFGLGDYSKYKFGYMIYTSADLSQYTNSGWVTADVSNLDFSGYAIGFNFAHLSGSGAIPASELEEIHNLFSISVTGQMLTVREEIETLQSDVASLKSAESAHENNLLPQIGANPFRFNPCYDHLFINSKTDAVIPHESLYHVRLSKKFGFDVIEANVSATSDGVYVVNHLENYKFGGYFHHVDGTTDISDILLSSVTWDWVVANVRYNSTIAKYQTRPCRLEEFLQECRQQNLIPFITSSDTNVIAIADQYMGKDNYIAYGASREDCPHAIIYHWVSNLETKEDILAYCESVGKPFIFGLGNVSNFTDSELRELVAELHENGYMIGIAYSDNNWHKYASIGFDVNATIRHINRIENGNLCNLNSAFNFSDFEYTNATLSNGILTFSSAGTIKPKIENINYPFCGFDVEFDMTGTVTIPAVGEQKSSYNLNSDGSYPVFCATPIINGSPAITINVSSGTVIRDVYFKASVFAGLVDVPVGDSTDLINGYFTPAIEGTGNISRDDGSVGSDSTYSHSDYIDISGYSQLTTRALYDSAFNAFYDANKGFVSAFVIRTGTDLSVAIPANAVYMRVSTLTERYDASFIFRYLARDNADKITALQEEVNSLANQGTDYFVPPIISTGYISRDDGTEQASADYSRSDYVNITDFKQLTTYATVTGHFNAFYDANKNFISAFSVRAGDGLTLEIPDGAVYMRVSTGTSSYNSTYIFGTVSHSNATRISDLEDTVDGLLNGDSGEFFSPPSAGAGNVSRSDGTIQSSNYLHSDYIDISQYSRLITNAEVGSAFNAFYRADKTFIAPFSIVAGADKNIEVPFGAMYMRVSAGNDVYDSVMKFRTLESITSDALPDYWYGHITDKADILRSRMATIGRAGETFIFATDIHWYMNQQKSPKLIKYLLNNLNINMVFLGGDLITEGAKADEVVESLRCIKAFQYPDVFTPMVFGNHDNNSNQSDATQRFDANTIYSLFFKGFEDNVTWMTDTEFSFYFDKPVNKTRYIFLDMGDDGVSRAFTAFAPFRDALLSTPSGYKIVIVAHIIDYGTFTTSLTQMIDAYNARTTVTVNSVVCDFTSASGSVVICLGGHRHYDDETATAGGVPITVTDCDAMLSVSDITETAGTITEQAFDVVSLDYTNNLAYYERVGRGKSRIIHMAPVSASTTLTTSLSGTVTWSSRDDSIATVSNGVITRVASGTVIIRADNGTETEIWVCNS